MKHNQIPNCDKLVLTVLVKSGGSEMCPCLFISSFRKVPAIFYTTEVSVSQHCMPPFV